MAPTASSLRGLAATTAAAGALLSTCDVLPAALAFNQPLHIGLTPSAQSVGSSRSRHLPSSLSQSPIQRGQQNNRSKLLSAFIEEPPLKINPDPSDDDAEESLATTATSITAPTAPTPLEHDIDEMLEDQSQEGKTKLLKSLKSVSSNLAEKVGAIDEGRIAFPELTTGEVPRLYSNLKYDKSANGKVSSSKHASGSTLAATAVIAGQTLGVSMLHLPSATAPSGFIYSSAAMVPTWIYSMMSGLLIAELCINKMGTTGKRDVQLMDLYDQSLGKVSSTVGTLAYFGLQFAIILACMATGGANVGLFLNSVGMGDFIDAYPGVQQLAFALVVGSAAFLARPADRDTINNVTLVGAFSLLLGIIGIGAGSADVTALLAAENQHPETVINALPILFMAIGYQTVMPKVATQLEGDKGKITTAVVAGTAIPVVLYIIWNAIVLGNTMTGPGLVSAGLDPVSLLQSQGSPLLGGLVGLFSELVVASTLFSFAGSFVETAEATFKVPMSDQEKWKPAFYACALLPAAFLSAGDATGACRALDYAGAFSLSTLFLVLPSIMIWKSRYGEDETPLTVKPMVPLGKVSLGSLWKAAGTLIIEQGAEKLGIIDFIKDQFFH